jgi:hypothetical protein
MARALARLVSANDSNQERPHETALKGRLAFDLETFIRFHTSEKGRLAREEMVAGRVTGSGSSC